MNGGPLTAWYGVDVPLMLNASVFPRRYVLTFEFTRIDHGMGSFRWWGAVKQTQTTSK